MFEKSRTWAVAAISSTTLMILTFALDSCVKDDPYVAGDVKALCRVQEESFIRGANFIHSYLEGQGYGSEACRTSLGALADLGANWVMLVPLAYQEHHRRPTLVQGEDSLDMPSIAATIRMAHDLGLKVALRPLVLLAYREIEAGTWRGLIGMGNEGAWRTWFAQYEAFVLPHARSAGEQGADLFVVGSELDGTVHRCADWSGLVSRVREVYTGPVTYMANHDRFSKVAFWGELDYIAVNSYHNLGKEEAPTLDAMKRSWAKYLIGLDELQKEHGLPVLFGEIGYKSASSGVHDPWLWCSSGRADTALQARAFEAFFEIMTTRNWFEGGFVWKWFSNDEIVEHRNYKLPFPWMEGYFEEEHPVNFEVRGKPAEGVLKRLFTGEGLVCGEIEESNSHDMGTGTP